VYGIIGYQGDRAAFWDDEPDLNTANARRDVLFNDTSKGLTRVELVENIDVSTWRREHGYGS
jgi:hypothetical protein